MKPHLTIVVLPLILAACKGSPIPSVSLPVQATDRSIPESTSYPGPIQSRTSTPSNAPIQRSTLTLRPSPSIRITPTNPPDTPTAPRSYFSDLKMFDARNGWAVMDVHPSDRPEYSRILRTMDGLQSWVDVSPPIAEESSGALAATFWDTKTALAIHHRTFLPSSGVVEVTAWWTTDGGQTWQARGTISSDLGVMERIGVSFSDQSHGWILGIGSQAMWSSAVHIFETQDGGDHWELVYAFADHLSDPDPLSIGGYYPFTEHFAFVTTTAGFFSDGRMFSTQDGGRTWSPRPINPPADLPDLDCTSNDCKYMDTISVPEFPSSQDGLSVRRVYLTSEEVMASFTYGDPLKRLPEFQYLYYTHDGGQTWVPTSSPVKIGTVSFLDGQRGWLLGKSDPDQTAPILLYQTTDAGKTWNQITANCPLLLGSELQFIDDQTGFAFYTEPASYIYRAWDMRVMTSDQYPTVFSTQDGGRSWVEFKIRAIP